MHGGTYLPLVPCSFILVLCEWLPHIAANVNLHTHEGHTYVSKVYVQKKEVFGIFSLFNLLYLSDGIWERVT